MGQRQAFARKHLLVAAITILAIVACAAFSWRWRSESASGGIAGGKCFYSVDDGMTLFVDNDSRVPPFDYHGRQAYRAHVFSCDDGATKWVGYLERCRPESCETMGALLAERAPRAKIAVVLRGAMDFKKPGEAAWVNELDRGAARVLNVKCPHVGQHVAREVWP